MALSVLMKYQILMKQGTNFFKMSRIFYFGIQTRISHCLFYNSQSVYHGIFNHTGVDFKSRLDFLCRLLSTFELDNLTLVTKVLDIQKNLLSMTPIDT